MVPNLKSEVKVSQRSLSAKKLKLSDFHTKTLIKMNFVIISCNLVFYPSKWLYTFHVQTVRQVLRFLSLSYQQETWLVSAQSYIEYIGIVGVILNKGLDYLVPAEPSSGIAKLLRLFQCDQLICPVHVYVSGCTTHISCSSHNPVGPPSQGRRSPMAVFVYWVWKDFEKNRFRAAV